MNYFISIILGSSALIVSLFIFELMYRKTITKKILFMIKKMKSSISFVSKKKFLLSSPQLFINLPKQSQELCKLFIIGYLFSWWHLKKSVNIYSVSKKLYTISIKPLMSAEDKEEQQKLLAFLMMELDLLGKKLSNLPTK